jgi:hypothetical protein
MNQMLSAIEKSKTSDWTLFNARAFDRSGAFDFIHLGYVWHFTNVTTSRYIVMRETWRRICHNYDGGDLIE